ncbi:MAG TPA: hypothetical protein VIL01_16670 [Thermomicrobiales bacterium]
MAHPLSSANLGQRRRIRKETAVKGAMMIIGLFATRAAMAVVVVALVLGLGISNDSAEAAGNIKIKTKVSISADEFTGLCHEAGADSVQVHTDAQVVNCFWDDGYSVSCDFKAKECVDTVPIPRRNPRGARNPEVAAGADRIKLSDGYTEATSAPVPSQAPVQETVVVADRDMVADPAAPIDLIATESPEEEPAA